MIFSDPKTFSKDSINAQVLIKYLKGNSSIKLAVPAFMLKVLNSFELSNEVYCFIDTELSIWKNINPLFPRGYLSMTLYKALSWSVHLGFEKIGVIGMDNTYPRNIYNDQYNNVCNLEVHAGDNDYLADQSSLYPNVASLLEDLVLLFRHLEYFPAERIFNLDFYSLTDRFSKTDIKTFFENSYD